MCTCCSLLSSYCSSCTVLSPPYQSLQLVEKLKADGEAQQQCMEGLIEQHKADACARDSLVGETAAASRETPVPRATGPLQVPLCCAVLCCAVLCWPRQD
jgi:hypothetical protein